MEELRVVVEQARGERSFHTLPQHADTCAFQYALAGHNTRVTLPIENGKARVLAFYSAWTAQKFVPAGSLALRA